MTKFLPRQAVVDAFGSGGFRFADMSHRGSILSVPSGMRAWDYSSVDSLVPEAFDQVIAERAVLDFLLVGTGAKMQRPPAAVSAFLKSENINVDFMDTGAAIHTYNWILNEGRRVAAALIAVDNPGGR